MSPVNSLQSQAQEVRMSVKVGTTYATIYSDSPRYGFHFWDRWVNFRRRWVCLSTAIVIVSSRYTGVTMSTGKVRQCCLVEIIVAGSSVHLLLRFGLRPWSEALLPRERGLVLDIDNFRDVENLLQLDGKQWDQANIHMTTRLSLTVQVERKIKLVPTGRLSWNWRRQR